MDRKTAQSLIQLNKGFYAQVAESFSETRLRPWPGWDTVADCIESDLPGKCRACPKIVSCPHAPNDATAVSVVDLACGNMRFEAFLEHRLPNLSFSFLAVDCTDAFPAVPVESPLRFQQSDILNHLETGDLAQALGTPQCQVAASFGFMHHIPTSGLRRLFLQAMAGMVTPGGLVCVSLWDFMRSPKLMRKAEGCQQRALRETGIGKLDDGDFLLGWQDMPGTWRYCHSFDEEEVDDLAECLEPEARVIRRFRADGLDGQSNSYLVFQRS